MTLQVSLLGEERSGWDRFKVRPHQPVNLKLLCYRVIVLKQILSNDKSQLKKPEGNTIPSEGRSLPGRVLRATVQTSGSPAPQDGARRKTVKRKGPMMCGDLVTSVGRLSARNCKVFSMGHLRSREGARERLILFSKLAKPNSDRRSSCCRQKMGCCWWRVLLPNGPNTI